MMSTMDNTVLDNTRNRRLPSFDPLTSLSSPLGFGSSFGMGKNPWSTNADIWRSASRFTDGASDEDSLRDTTRPTLRGDGYSTAKTGSGSLLSSSESETQPRRSNMPWNASVSTTEATTRVPTQLISPTRQHPLESRQDKLQASETFSGSKLTAGAGAFLSALPEKSGSITQGSQSTSLRRSFEPTKFKEFQPLFLAEKRRQGYNSTTYGTNQNVSTGSNFAATAANAGNYATPPAYANGFTRPIQHSSGAAFGTQDNSSGQNSSSASDRGKGSDVFGFPTKRQFLQPTTNPHGAIESQEHGQSHLIDAFGNMGIEDEPSQWHSDYTYQNSANKAPPFYSTNLQSFPVNGYKQLPDTKADGMLHSPQNGIHDYNLQNGSNYYRNSSFGEPTTASPSTRGLQTPFFSASVTPPTGSESFRSTSGSALSNRISNGHANLLDRKLRGLESYAQGPQFFQPNPLTSQMQYNAPPLTYDYSTYPQAPRMNPLLNPYSLLPGYVNMAGQSNSARHPPREQDSSQIIRSPLLEEFRTNSKTSKRYELRDICNHVVEFSGDQHGSRFIQQKLETANSDEKDQVFAEILPNSLQLMTDVFGNYVIQKLFEHGNQSQKKLLANQMKSHVLSLSLQMYGCRVVQKALEHILTDQQASMVKELEGQVLRCVKDQNGNHVVQKAIERVPAEYVQFIVDAFHKEVQRLATHPYGCRVIQRMLEHCQPPAKRAILLELHACVPLLITDQFGNYVIQHVIENGDADDRRRVVSVVLSQLLMYSKHKFASNVVEKSIEFAEEPQRRQVLLNLTATNDKGEGPVLSLMRDQYGNYVIQKVLTQLQGEEREALVNQIKSQLVNLKRISYGKQILAIEKVIFDSEHPSLSTSTRSSTAPSAAVSTDPSTVEGQGTPPRVHLTKPSTSQEGQIALPLATSMSTARP